MGLKLTLTKGNNHLAYDFVDAYWAITDLSYDTANCYFRLRAYPSREAKLADLSPVPFSTLPVGGASYPVVNCSLYMWEASIPTAQIFPSGIPLDADEQKTVVYNFIKAYTGLPYEDVFEEEQT